MLEVVLQGGAGGRELDGLPLRCEMGKSSSKQLSNSELKELAAITYCEYKQSYWWRYLDR